MEPRGLFVIIGAAGDECAERVAGSLRDAGLEVVLSADPLVDPYDLTWRLGSSPPEDEISWGTRAASPREIAGVLVRGARALVEPDEWTEKDSAYVQSERHAALIAWLSALPCTVINRPSPEYWFRPARSFPEWSAILTGCGLPTAAICVTNQIEAAHDWAGRWAGCATYAPITSSSRYPLVEPAHWNELAKLTAVLPVCLLPPCAASASYGTVIRDQVVWDDDRPRGVAGLEPALLRLGSQLKLDFLQIEVACDEDGFHCLSVDPDPKLERHDEEAQGRIIANLVELLLASEHGVPDESAKARPTAHSLPEIWP